MIERPNVLVVCGRNKKRSRTAEFIFKNDSRFNIRSVGLSPRSSRQISDKDINWSDLIFVMEQGYGARILGAYRHLDIPPIENLHIDDDYEYLDDILIELLRDRINSTLRIIYKF
jgi:predicted protein tyrosine phosphatase